MHSGWTEWTARSRNRIIFVSILSILFVFFIYHNMEDPEILQASPRMINFKPKPVFSQRIVHLDLKGAPPKPSFYEKFFPLLKEIGITSVLMEYEDMFPYWGKLSMLKTKNAYDSHTIAHIQNLAHKNSLEIIPLVQTFGHMEFVLKHLEFSSLREVPEKTDTICPSDENSIQLIHEMLAQIRQLHPNVSSIHIGADEAWNIAKDERCFQKLHKIFHNSEERLKLSHISRVAKYAKDELKFDRVYGWNDMFSSIDSKLLKEYDLGRLLVPVVWGYAPDVTIDGYFPYGMFQRYSQVFPNILFASAFKGSNGINEIFMDIDRYFSNLFSYHRLFSIFHQELQNRVSGIVFTGWQRYFHTAPLCELMPVGMPSLINEALYELDPTSTPSVQRQRLLDFLKCESVQPVQPINYHGHVYHPPNEIIFKQCHFLGSDVFSEVENLRLLKWKINIDGILTHETRLELQSLTEKIKSLLLKDFYEDAVNEWIVQNLNPQTIIQKFVPQTIL